MSKSGNYIRANTTNTGDLVAKVLEYAKLDFTTDIRLAITRRYVDESELPYNDFTLLHNSPLLLIAVSLQLPATDLPLVIVFDYPGLNMQREPRANEVRDLVEQLIAIAPKKIYYGTQPIGPTREMEPDLAARNMLASDYAALSPDTLSDFYRRMGNQVAYR